MSNFETSKLVESCPVEIAHEVLRIMGRIRQHVKDVMRRCFD
jgi:hypothetical protein